MLDPKIVASETERVIANLRRRGQSQLESIVKDVARMDQERKEVIQFVEKLKQQRNEASEEIARRKKEKKDAEELLSRMKGVSQQIKEADERQAVIEARIRESLAVLPNLLDDTVPDGKSADDNRVEREWGKPAKFPFPARTHDEIGEKLGLLDFKKAGEVSGARFVFLKGLASKLERALVSFMVDTHLSAGYQEISPPYLVNPDALFGTGQFPKFKEDVFRVEGAGLYLIPTAEVPVTNYHREEILDGTDLPKKYVAFTPCFRSEAGSYGKDTKGLKRQHQFDKVELVKFTHPDRSTEELESLTRDAERILQKLELPYRVVTLCAGDIGFGSAKTYDIEVWSPGANAYMEISSCSNFRDFQARRANIRFRDTTTKKVAFAHTLNGSGLAVGRTLLAIIENCQKEDGSFAIPKALEPYCRVRGD